jgi:hypothetical protein
LGALVSELRRVGNPERPGPKAMDEPAQMKLGRFLWAGPLTIVVSVVAVLVIRTLAVTILNPDEKFLPLTKGTPIFDTVLCGACAIFAFILYGPL